MKLLVILLVFFSSGVQAGLTLPVVLKPIQLPENCLSDGVYPCAIQTQSGVQWKLKKSGYVVAIHEKSSFLLISEKEMRLLRGAAWLHAKDSVSLHTVYGEVLGIGEFWVSQDKVSSQVGVHSGKAYLFPRDRREVLSVEVGMQNWMGRVDSKGRSSVGIPQPLVLNEHMSIWTSLNLLTKVDFSDRARIFLHHWSMAAQKSSVRQKVMAKRLIASIEEKRAKRKAALDRLHSKESKMRDLFRRRNFFN